MQFRNDAKFLETIFSGLTSLSSGYNSAWADDSICLRRDRYLSARSSCPQFAAHATVFQDEAGPRSTG